MYSGVGGADDKYNQQADIGHGLMASSDTSQLLADILPTPTRVTNNIMWDQKTTLMHSIFVFGVIFEEIVDGEFMTHSGII